MKFLCWLGRLQLITFDCNFQQSKLYSSIRVNLSIAYIGYLKMKSSKFSNVKGSSGLYIGLALTFSFTLISCANNDDSPEFLDHTELTELSTDGGILIKSSAEQTSLTIKNGVFIANFYGRNYNTTCNECDFAVEAVAESAATDDASADGSADFSSTTTQEEGVAVSDRVKYDGNRMFLASNNDYGYYSIDTQSDNNNEDDIKNKPHVRILERQSDDSLIEQSIVATDDSAYNLSDLYLNQNRMMTIYNTYEQVSQQTSATSDIASTSVLTSEPYWYGHNSFGININDITESAQPTELVKYNI